MAISHVDTNTATQGNATSVSATKPTGTDSGDLLLAFFTSNSQNATPPSGWTEILDEAIEVFRCQIFYKVAGGSEPSSYSFSVGSAAPLVLSVTALRGVDASNPIDIDPVTDTNFSQSEPHSTPGVTGGTSGRLVYLRTVRFSGSTVPTFTASATELADVGVFSGGSVCYAQGLYMATSDYSTSGSQSGLAITTSQSESHNITATIGVKSSGVPGTMQVELPVPAVSVSASQAIPGDLDVELPLLDPVAIDVFHGAYEGSLDVQVPILVDIQGSPDPLGTLDVQIPIAADFLGETRRFAENVVSVDREERWLVITQDGYRFGNRGAVRDFSVSILLPELGPVSFEALVSALGQTVHAPVDANKPTVVTVFSAGTASASVSANDATVLFGDIAPTGASSVAVTANHASVELSTLPEHVSVSAEALNASGFEAPAELAPVSAVANDATVQSGLRAFAGHAPVKAFKAPESSALAGHAPASVAAFSPPFGSEDLVKHAESVGNGTNTSYTVTHNFGSRDVIVRVYDNATFEEVRPDVEHTTTNAVTVEFAVAPSTNAYRVVVLYSDV